MVARGTWLLEAVRHGHDWPDAVHRRPSMGRMTQARSRDIADRTPEPVGGSAVVRRQRRRDRGESGQVAVTAESHRAL